MTFMVMMEKIYRLITLMVERQLALREVVLMLMYLLPQALAVTLPFAVVGAVFITVIRQSVDLEVIVMRATGRSLWGYALPFVTFGLLATAATFLVTLWLQPAGYSRFINLQLDMVRLRAQEKLHPGAFNTDFGDKVIRVGAKGGDGEVTSVFLSDRVVGRNSPTVMADRGRVLVDELAKRVVFRLQDGAMYFTGTGEASVRTVDFGHLNYVLRFDPGETTSFNEYWGLSTPELMARIEDPNATPYPIVRVRWVLELYNRVTSPWACLVFALAAVPMAIVDPRSGRAGSFLRAIFLVLSYYLVWLAFKDLAYSGDAPAAVMWMPPVLILVYGLLRLGLVNADVPSPWRLLRRRLAPPP